MADGEDAFLSKLHDSVGRVRKENAENILPATKEIVDALATALGFDSSTDKNNLNYRVAQETWMKEESLPDYGSLGMQIDVRNMKNLIEMAGVRLRKGWPEIDQATAEFEGSFAEVRKQHQTELSVETPSLKDMEEEISVAKRMPDRKLPATAANIKQLRDVLLTNDSAYDGINRTTQQLRWASGIDSDGPLITSRLTELSVHTILENIQATAQVVHEAPEDITRAQWKFLQAFDYIEQARKAERGHD